MTRLEDQQPTATVSGIPPKGVEKDFFLRGTAPFPDAGFVAPGLQESEQ
jgi:hypothetical protein